MYLHKTPWLLKQLYSNLIWNKGRREKNIYLTFDDGPVPGVTEFVLDKLQEYNAKATFFCVGDNINKNQEIFPLLIEAKHRIGNHTFHHLSGWNSEDEAYFQNIKKCEELIPAHHVKLFRPPYGRIKRSQIKRLATNYQIIMWDVLTGDFDKALSPEACLNKSIRCTRNGSIIIFHDSVKAERNLKYALPRFLDHFSEKGYQFLAL